MIYSVYSYGDRAYRYYEVAGPVGTHADAPARPLLPAPGGVTPEAAAFRLPAGAKLVGSGPFPKGRIASSGVALAGLGDLAADLPRVGIIAGLLYLGWRALR